MSALRISSTLIIGLSLTVFAIAFQDRASAQDVKSSPTTRVVGFWQRVEYPGLVENVVARILQSDLDALKSYLRFHAREVQGRIAVRAERWDLIRDKNEDYQIGLQTGLVEYPAVFLLQMNSDTIVLLNLAIREVVVPRYVVPDASDTLITMRFTHSCKHYLTSNGYMVRRLDCSSCPLNYQDNGERWRPDADGGMLVPITNMIKRDVDGGSGRDVSRHYRTRLLPAPEFKGLLNELQLLNDNIDSALDESTNTFEQLLFSYGGNFDHSVGIPVKVSDVSADSKTMIDMILTSRKDLLYGCLKWDDSSERVIKGPRYQKYFFHTVYSEFPNGHRYSDTVCGSHCQSKRWGQPQEEHELLSLDRLGVRLFWLNNLRRITNNSYELALESDGSSKIDSLTKVIATRTNDVDMYSSVLTEILQARDSSNARFPVADVGAGVKPKPIVVMSKTDRGSNDSSTTYQLVPTCNALKNTRAHIVLRAQGQLMTKAARKDKRNMFFGRPESYDKIRDREAELTRDSTFFSSVKKLRSRLEKFDNIKSHKTYRTLASLERSMDSALAHYSIQVNKPIGTHRYVEMRGDCSDNHVLNLFALAVQKDSMLLEEDEDDVVDSMMLGPYESYQRGVTYVATQDEIDDFDDSVEVYQALYEDGELLDRLVSLPGDLYNVYQIDQQSAYTAVEDCLMSYLETVALIRDSIATALANDKANLIQAQRCVQLRNNTTIKYPSLFTYAPNSAKHWPPTNYLGSKVSDIDAAVADYRVSRGYDGRWSTINGAALSKAIESVPAFSYNKQAGIAVNLSLPTPKYSLFWIAQARVGNNWRGADVGQRLFANKTYLGHLKGKTVLLAGEEEWLSSKPAFDDFATQQTVLLIGSPNVSSPYDSRPLVNIEQMYYLGWNVSVSE
jgi:hypothetical protein